MKMTRKNRALKKKKIPMCILNKDSVFCQTLVNLVISNHTNPAPHICTVLYTTVTSPRDVKQRFSPRHRQAARP